MEYRSVRFAEIQVALCDLLPKHWEEVALDQARIELQPDFARYLALDAAGKLITIGMFDGLKLRGYHISCVDTHLHYKQVLHDFGDVYYVHPDHRGAFSMFRLFEAAENEMRARRVGKIYIGCKTHLDLTPLLERMGYRHTEKTFTKLL